MTTMSWRRFDDPFRWTEDVLRAFTPLFDGGRTEHAIPVNVYDDGEGFLVRAELPGADKDSLRLAVDGDKLTLSGTRKGASFERVLTLALPVDADRIQAHFKHGLLEVTLPRLAAAKARTIEIH